jgi:phosphatidylinositol alpha-1,6-mannosyltransferase
VLHGAEVTVPARLPVGAQALAHVVGRADLLVAAGPYPAAQAERLLGRPGSGPRPRRTSTVVVPPGVDTDRFRPLTEAERRDARRSVGLPDSGRLVVSVSRLVPRKGMDTLIAAARRLARTHTDLTVAIAGAGRDRHRLALLARGAPVRFLGRVPDDRLPALHGCADAFAMICRDRWGGLEQEGFGIVFLEAAACGVPQVAGASGGAADAVVDGQTGLIVRQPAGAGGAADTAGALGRLLDDPELRARLGDAARARAERDFAYDGLAARLRAALVEAGASLRA